MPSRALAALAGEPLKKTRTISLSADFLATRVGHHRAVEKAAVRFAALDEALVLEPLEHRAHRRAAQLVGQGIANVGDGQGPALVEDVDDLAFAGRQLAEHFQFLFGTAESPRYICRVLHL